MIATIAANPTSPRRLILSCLIAGAVSMSHVVGQTTYEYPKTRRVDHVDDYHGAKVADPYRWLEEDVRESDAVADWVEQQNKVTQSFLESIPERDGIEERLTELWNYEKQTTPFREGGRYFYFKNDGLQNQNVLYKLTTLDAEPEVLIDPNTWTKDGTTALSGIAVSEDGRYIAYGVAQAGSDWNTWKVMEIESGKLLDDELNWVKFSGASWSKDSRGFYYSRYPEPAENAEFQSLNMNQKVFYHKAGTPQSQDRMIYERPDNPEWGFGADVTEDGRFLVIIIWKGTDDKYMVVYRDLSDSDSQPVELISEFKFGYDLVGSDGTTLFFKTDNGAPKGRLIAIDTLNPTVDHWREIIPESEETLTGVDFVGNKFIADYLKDARTQIKVFSTDGTFDREVQLPGIGTARGFGGKRTETETFYSYTSFATPTTIFRYDVRTGESTQIRKAAVKFSPDDYEVSQVFFDSKEGRIQLCSTPMADSTFL